MITRLSVYDFDGTLINSPMPETGKREWELVKKIKNFPFSGWWSKPESLDLNIFDIKPFPSVLAQLKKEQATSNTYVVILTSRMEKLRLQVEAVLIKNNIHVDKLDMQRDQRTKGQKILDYTKKFPDLREINVYDDKNTDIMSYEGIRSSLPENIKFNIYLANQGNLTLVEAESKLISIIKEEIEKF